MSHEPEPFGWPQRRHGLPAVAAVVALLLGAGPARGAPCVSCRGGSAASADIPFGVNVALGTASLDVCPLLDADRNDRITVDELVEGVKDRINACPTGTDRDGNGIADGQECGADSAVCVDTDADTLADFEDPDDDDDGLPDVNDPHRTAPSAEADPLAQSDLFVALEARLDVEADGVPLDVARVGDRLVIRGQGFDPDAQGNAVLFEGDGGVVASTPLVATATELTVLVPDGSGPRLRVARGDRRTAPLPLTLLPRGAPVLFRSAVVDTEPAATLRLRGLDLESVTGVAFAGADAAPAATTPTSVEVVVPAQARTGEVAVRRNGAVSNTALLRVTRTTEIEVALPPGAAIALTDLVVSAGIEIGVAVDAGGHAQLRTNRTGLDIVTASRAGGETPRPYLQALVLPGDPEVQLDATSTAIVMLVGATGLISAAEEASVAQARTQVAALPALQSLAGALAAGLAADADFLLATPPSFDAL